MKTFHRFSLAVLSLLFLLTSFTFAQSGLVISEVYGGGGNSGAVYTNDFVELYNPTASGISISGYSLQYTSAAGSTWSTNKFALPSATIAAGHYYLIQAGPGAGNGVALPTPDATSTIAISATAGKVALVSNNTALSGSTTGISPLGGATCPNVNNSAIVDFVGFGTATCYEGTGPTAATANATAAIRTNPATNTHDNSKDFTVGTPVAHNSSYGTQSASLSAVGTANPSTVISGSTTLLTVTVTPAANPASTGISVTANLSAIGGSASQVFYDDGTHGDVTAGDNIFSFNTTATTSTNTTVSLPVSVTDAQTHTATANISLTVNQPVAFVPIHTIQGSKSLTATSVSSYAGRQVSTSGIVVGVGAVGFFIEAKDSDADSDPTTPEGIYVYMGSGKVPAIAVIGNELLVTGAVSTYPAVTASHTPATEISSATVSLLSTGNALPTAVPLTISTLNPAGGLYQLTPYEGMRVTVSSLTSTSGTDGTLTEASETVTSNGQFYGVITGTARPFREPGLDVRDTPPTGAPANLARFDDNPERILVDSTFFGGSAINLTTGTVLQNISGVLDFTYSQDSYYDPSRLLLDKTYTPVGNVSGGSAIPVVDPAASNEFTVAAFNVERFFNTNSADDLYFDPVKGTSAKSSAVDITATAYARRLAKVSLAIRNVLGSPDIVSLEETENQSVVSDIAAKISSDAIAAGQPDPQYLAYGTGTSYAPYTNDIGGISVGFLVKSTRVSTIGVDQYGQNTLMTDPRDGVTQIVLNDRPPLVLHAGVIRANAKPYPVTVIVNHLRSLSGVNDPSTGVYVRAKKELQGEYLANLIQGFQLNGEHVVSVGDYNVFEFSDALTDVMATVTGQTPLPSDQVVRPALAGIVYPPATDLVTLLPAAQRWSYVESGSAQVLDHIVVTSDLVAAGAHVQYAHFDADFPYISYNDATTPARVSDHDAAVAYLAIGTPSLAATLTPASVDFGQVAINSTSVSQQFVLTNTGEANIDISGISVSSGYIQTSSCGASVPYSTSCTINVSFTPTVTGTNPGTLSVTASSGTYSSTLSGMGTLVPQTINISQPDTLTYGVGSIPLKASATSNLPVTLSVISGPGTLTGTTLNVKGAGAIQIQGTQAGDAYYAPATPVNVTVTVNPASLTATANNKSVIFGLALPALDGTLTGVVPGDGITASYTTVATKSSPAGSYDILPILADPKGALPNYTVTINKGTLTVTADTAATLLTPASGGTLGSSNVQFTWTSGTGVNGLYQVLLGTTGAGSSDLFNSGNVTATSISVPVIPANAQTVNVRLLSRLYSGWAYVDYTFTESGIPTPAVIQLPTPGSVLAGSNVTFKWDPGIGATAYQLLVGTTGAGSSDVFASGFLTATSAPVSGIPANAATVYVRLLAKITGVWQFNDYTYTEAGTPAPATIQSPSAGSKLGTTDVAFTWTTGVGVNGGYQLLVGTNGAGSSNLYSSGVTASTAAMVSSIPANAVPVYVRLLSKISGSWSYIDYTYTEAGTVTAAILQTPTPGGVLGTSGVQFTWTAGVGINGGYQLLLGTTGVGSSNLYSSGVTAATTATVPVIPTGGKKVYVRLFSRSNGVWQYNDYTYTEQ